METVCVDLDDAYRYRAATMTGRGAAPHLDLAEWCLRHDLTSQAGEQLVAAMRKEPAHGRIATVERRLKLAIESPKAEPVRHPDSAATVSAEQLDKTIRALPPGSLEKFSAVVQPILLNRCVIGANSIVGANTLIPEGKVFPEGVLIVGSPGKIVRELSPDEIARLKLSAAGYVENWKRYAAGLTEMKP